MHSQLPQARMRTKLGAAHDRESGYARAAAKEYSAGIARVVWEREAEVRTALLGKPGTPWAAKADSLSPLAGNWSKIGVDHMFDHIWKTFEFPSAERKTEYPGVAQLVAHVIWVHGAGRSNRPTRTTFVRKTAFLGGFSVLKVRILNRD